jgi:hypothetical protein
MKRTIPNITGTFVFVLFTSSGFTQPVSWPGHVLCSVVVNESSGYQHQETQRWDINGQANACTGGTCYPYAWQVQGNGGDGINWWFESATWTSPTSVFVVEHRTDGTNRLSRQYPAALGVTTGAGQTMNGSKSGVDEWEILQSSGTNPSYINMGSNMIVTGSITLPIATPPLKPKTPATCMYSFGSDSSAQQFPSAVSTGAGAFEVFGLDPWDSKIIRHKSYTAAGAWRPGPTMQAPWGSTGAGGPPQGFVNGPVAAVALSSTLVHVFAIGPDGVAYHNLLSGPCGTTDCPMGSWESIGANPPVQFLGSIAAVKTDANTVELFAMGSDGKAYRKSFVRGTGTASDTWTPPQTSAWTKIGGIPGTLRLNPSPAASSWSDKRFDVFATGENGKVYHKFFRGVWNASGPGSEQGDWESLGGSPASTRSMGSPSVVSWGPVRLDIFVNGIDGNVYHKYFAAGWGPNNIGADWESLGGVPVGARVIGSPAAVSWGPDHLDIFVTGTDGIVYHKSYSAAGWRPGGMGAAWEPLGGSSSPVGERFTGSPAVIVSGPNRIDVFVINGSAKAYHKFRDGNSWGPGSRSGNWELISN